MQRVHSHDIVNLHAVSTCGGWYKSHLKVGAHHLKNENLRFEQRHIVGELLPA